MTSLPSLIEFDDAGLRLLGATFARRAQRDGDPLYRALFHDISVAVADEQDRRNRVLDDTARDLDPEVGGIVGDVS